MSTNMMSAVSASNSLNVYMVTETLEYTAIKEITYVLQNLSEKKKTKFPDSNGFTGQFYPTCKT